MASSAPVLQLLNTAYSGSKEERTNATASLEAALKSADGPQNLVALFRAGFDAALPAEQSLLALLYAKNCLVYTLSEEDLARVPGLVAEIEDIVFNGSFVVPQSHRRVARQCIATLVSAFNWNYLDQLLPDVVSFDPAHVPSELALARMEILYTFTKRFKTPNLEPMPMKLEVAGAVLSVLPTYFAYEDFRVSHYTFKVMECVLETALQLSSAKDIPGDAFDAWFDLMAAFPQRYYEAAAHVGGKAYEEYVLCTKRIAMITYSILNDATRRKKPAPLASHFLSKYGGAFLSVWRQWLQHCLASSDRSVHRKSEMFAIRYLKLSTLDEALYTQFLRPHAVEVVEQLFFPYLCYNEEDEEVFADDDDLAEYVQYMVDEGAGMGELTPRQAASNAILAMIGGKKPFHSSQTLLQELLGVLTNGLGLADSTENFPRVFGFLHLLSILRKYLRGVPEIWQNQMAQVLMHYVAPRLSPANPFPALRCKTLVVCQRYSKVPMPSEADMQAFVEMICGLLQDKDARLRLGAIDAMCTLLEMPQARVYMRSYLVPLVEECLSFLNKVQTTFIPTAILHLTTYFAPELTPVMGKLGHTLCQHFLATAFDLEAMELGGADLDDAAALSRFENAAFSGDALLDAIYTIVTSCSENQQALDAMRAGVMRLVKRVLEQPDSFDFFEKTLGILLHVVAFCKPIPQDCWEVLPLLFQSVDSGIGVDFFSMIEEVLDNFVSGAPEAFMGNEQLMTAVYNLCHKMLIGGVVCAPECRAAPAQLIEAMLHVAKHAPQPGMFDPFLPRFVTLLLQALIHPDVVSAPASVRVWITAGLMDCFYYNAGATLSVMVESGAFPSFFHGFFHLYRGVLVPADQSSAAAAKRTKKSKASKQVDDAHAVVSSLSILTRKVITLGLSELLMCVTTAANDTASALHVTAVAFLSEFLQPLLTFVQYCIFTNEAIYETRCHIAEKNIADIRAGVEEAVPDVDPDDNVVLGMDGADDTELNGDEVEDWDEEEYAANGEGLFGGDVDEGDDYQSPIDDVNEVGLLLSWATALTAQPAELQACATKVLRTSEAYTNAANTAQRYRQLCLELETTMQEDFAKRSGQPTG